MYADIRMGESWRTIIRKYVSAERPREPEPDEAFAEFESMLKNCRDLISKFDGKLTGEEILRSFPGMASVHEPIARFFNETAAMLTTVERDAEEFVENLIEGQRQIKS